MDRRRLAILIAALAALLAAAGVFRITPMRLSNDGAENAHLQYSLHAEGRFAIAPVGAATGKPDPGARPETTMLREPFPVWVGAAYLRAIEVLAGPASLDQYVLGSRAQWLKTQNLIWVGLGGLGVFLAGMALSGSYWAGMASLAVFAMRCLQSPRLLDNLYTEISGAALLVGASGLLAVGLRDGRRGRVFVAGLLFGLLMLTKAHYLYVFLGLLASLALLLLWRGRGRLRIARAGLLALLTLGAALTVTPWMLRNQMQFGAFQITERGGQVLLTRAYKDMMTPEEYRGAFYVWAPGPLRPLMGKALGFSEADLQRGGRLQRLNRAQSSDFADQDLAAVEMGRPDLATSFFDRSRAEFVRLVKEAQAAGAANPRQAAGEAATREALAIIKAHPFRHLAATLPFVWRGECLAVLLGLFFLWSLWRGNAAYAVFALPALGSLAFFALLTHNIGRYSLTEIPILAVCLVLVTKALLESTPARRLRSRFAGGPSATPLSP